MQCSLAFARTLARALALIAAAVPAAAFAQSADTVARLGSIELKAADLKRLLDAEPPAVRAQIAASPQALDRIVRTELVRRAVLAEALAKGWDKRPEVAAQIERAREQVVVSSFVNGLARPGADYPSDAEVKAFYDANQGSLMLPRRYRVAQIYVKRPGEKAAAEAAAKKVADALGRARAAGADFGALARSASEHAESAANGGEIGWVAEDNLIPEMRPVIARLAKGAVSEPVPTAEGWHVVKLLDVAEPAPAPLEQVRPSIANTLRLRKAQELERAYIDALLAKTPPSLNEAELAKLRGSLR
jgi:peptidylprolyl isomerase